MARMAAPAPAFTARTLTFLRRLVRHNDRAWFHAHREEYEAEVRQPMVALVEQLALDFRRIAPDLVADPARSMFRPWRDTRFSENKAPLKTNIAAGFPHRALGRLQGAGLYLEVSPTGVWMGGGAWAPDTAQRLAIRTHIADHPDRFRRIVRAPAFTRIGGLQGRQQTRVPRGWAATHPAAEWLRYAQWLGWREDPAAFATAPDFYATVLGTFRALVPLVTFLNEPLVAQAVELPTEKWRRTRETR